MIFKDEEGTKVDQKPYRQNWKLATDALGVYLNSNILFSNKVLLVEGDSDPMYLYELMRQLNRVNEADIDLNMLGIMSFYDYRNLRFLLQVFRKEGQENSVVVLVDGDMEGKTTIQRVSGLCKRLGVATIRLAEGRSVEDYCLYDEEFIQAVKRTLLSACEAEGKPAPKDLDDKVREAWNEAQSHKDKEEKSEKAEKEGKAEKDKRDARTLGRWFNEISTKLIQDEASKVVLARTYAELCRESKAPVPNREKVKEAKQLCQDIAAKLDVPGVRAVKAIEVAQ